MMTLICSGNLFSNWQHIVEINALTNPEYTTVSQQLSVLSEEMCRAQFPDTDELNWRPFSPSEGFTTQASELFSSIEDEALFTWSDINCALNLDFWQSTIENASFLLFYSSPEYELASYINSRSFNEAHVEEIMQAWLVRTKVMLAFFMNNRSQCLLVNLQSADSERHLFVQLLNERFRLQIDRNASAAKNRSGNLALVEYLAASLLRDNELVSELYDEVRSAATVIGEQDASLENTQSRSRSLIGAFLNETTSYEQLTKSYRQLSESHKELENDLSLKQLQINQLKEELEYYFKSRQEQRDIFTNYLASDSLLNVARQARMSR